jgi:hypothetical protein
MPRFSKTPAQAQVAFGLASRAAREAAASSSLESRALHATCAAATLTPST